MYYKRFRQLHWLSMKDKEKMCSNLKDQYLENLYKPPPNFTSPAPGRDNQQHSLSATPLTSSTSGTSYSNAGQGHTPGVHKRRLNGTPRQPDPCTSKNCITECVGKCSRCDKGFCGLCFAVHTSQKLCEVHQHLRNPAAADDEDEEDDNHIDDEEED